MNYDIIGDIHGVDDALLSLLKKLSYTRKGGAVTSGQTGPIIGIFY